MSKKNYDDNAYEDEEEEEESDDNKTNISKKDDHKDIPKKVTKDTGTGTPPKEIKKTIPKIKPTHHPAKHLTPPSLFQFEVDIFGAAAENMELVEKIMRPPFAHLRLYIALVDSHFRINRITQTFQISPHVGLAFHLARIVDMRVGGGCYGIGKVYHSAGLKTWR